MIAVTVQIDYMYAIYYTFTCMFIGVCTFFLVFAADLEQCFTDLDASIRILAECKESKVAQQQIEVKRTMHDILRCRAEMKQLCDDFYISEILIVFAIREKRIRDKRTFLIRL